jgi:3,4-dihydroxy-9,10-secoandrosta-1,3,5(10)-triene-9,17-dione 4,5-dioxygenase
MRTLGLGYIGIDSTDPAAWRPFGTRVLGLSEVAARPAGGAGAPACRFKLDERSWRLAIHRAERDGLAYAGWELPGEAALADAVAQLRADGIEVEIADAQLCSARQVCGLASFRDLVGNRMELFWGALADGPFSSPAGVSGFLTGTLGMGHLLLTVPDAARSSAFYQRALGLRVTDCMDMNGGKSGVFLRATPRHHSLALTDLFPVPSLHHFMLEALTLQDVGLAYDRAQDAGAPITITLGQHFNDRMISFYVQTPGGFSVEFGCHGRIIDEATWTVTQFGGSGDIWGHRGPAMEAIATERRRAAD